MKYIFLIIIISLSALTSLAQSKKELQEQVKKLSIEVQQLKDANQKLTTPKVIDFNSEVSKVSYSIGILMGSQLKSQGADSVDLDAIQSGFKDIYSDEQPKIDQQEAIATVQGYFQKASEAKAEKMRAAGKTFLEENKKDPAVKETASGLQYKIVSSGTGKTPGTNDKVTVHYTGKLVDGTVFDSSVTRGEPASFPVTQVIKGWTEALQLMKEGDKWILFIPDHLGYGETGAGGIIPPYSTLIFEVELIKVN